MNNSDQRQKLRLLIPIALFVVFCIAVIIMAIVDQINKVGKIPVTIQFAPYSAQITIDGKKGKNNNTNYIAPGTHKLTVSNQDFDNYTTTINVDDNTTIIYGVLNPSNEAGEQILKRREQEFLDVQALAGATSIEDGDTQKADWPILNDLPIDNILYSIGYTFNQDQKLVITINTDKTYIDVAANKLITLNNSGYPVYDYEVIVTNYTNPFLNQFRENTNSDPIQYLRTGFSSVDCQVLTGVQDGDYYYTNISTGSSENYTIVHSKVILQRVNNNWKLAGTPYPVLTTANTPNVPSNIIDAANKLTYPTNN